MDRRVWIAILIISVIISGSVISMNVSGATGVLNNTFAPIDSEPSVVAPDTDKDIVGTGVVNSGSQEVGITGSNYKPDNTNQNSELSNVDNVDEGITGETYVPEQ